MNILGIDPGTRCTGFAIVSIINNKIYVRRAGSIVLSPSDCLSKRLNTIYLYVQKQIVDEKISCLVLETPFLGKNAQNFLKLGYVRGILYLLGEQNQLLLQEFSPKEIKRAITGSGNAQKDQVARALKAFFPTISIHEMRHDITDAIAVAFCGALSLQAHKIKLR